MAIQFHQFLQLLKMIFKESVCSTAEIQNQHKYYTEELHDTEEEADVSIEEDVQQNKHSAEVSSQQRKPNSLDPLGNISRCSI